MHKQEEKNLYLLGWILLGIFLSYLLIAKFSHFRTFFHLPCLFRTLTGYYCPDAAEHGMYRLFTWTFLRSLLYHPVVPYTAVVYLIFMISHSIELLSKGNFAIGLRYRDNYIKFAGIIILVQWILRNFLKWKWGIDVLGN